MQKSLTKKDLYVRLGYPTGNTELHKQDIIQERTARLETIYKLNEESVDGGIMYLIELATQNLEGLKTTIQWNIKNGITFYRACSELLPHADNMHLLKVSERDDYTKFVYPIEIFEAQFHEIGQLIKNNGIRLTFHSGPHVVLNSDKEHVLVNSTRDLYMHYLFIKYMGLTDSLIVLHGGNMGDDLEYYKLRLIKKLNALPAEIKNIIALENDENRYNIFSILDVAEATSLPVIFDTFHHKLYFNDHRLNPDPATIKRIKKTWKTQRMKIHIAEQNTGGRSGNHADYIKKIPDWVLEFPETYGEGIDVMVEAKTHELALFRLVKKYKDRIIL